MGELYAECHNPDFPPILINRWGFKKKARIDKSKSFSSYREALGTTVVYDTIKHLVYKVPERSAAVASHNLEKRDPILIQCNNPTPRAKRKAKKIAKKMAEKYNVIEFWLEEKPNCSSCLPYIEHKETFYDVDRLFDKLGL